MTTKVLGYIRVSTQIQSNAGTHENQRRAIKEYAKNNDLEVVDWFSDEGVSGFTMERQGLENLLSNLERADGVIVYDIDRLARNFELGTKLMFTLRDLGKRLYVVRTGEVFDFCSKEDQLLHVIKAWSADVVRDQIKENQKRGIERFKLKYGRWGRRTKKFGIKEWREYDELRAAGISNSKIANYFKIHRNTLRKLLKARAAKQAKQQPEQLAVQQQAQPEVTRTEEATKQELATLLEKMDSKTLERLIMMAKAKTNDSPGQSSQNGQ